MTDGVQGPAEGGVQNGASTVGDRYVLGALLGQGGMADVYRAHDQVLHREVAVKLLREDVHSPQDRARFSSEARMLAQLSHGGLVTLLDAGIEIERPFLVLELVEGQTLSARLRSGTLDLPEAAALGADVARALAYAHERDIVHRDVKPGNVLLGPEGRVKLADFGIARLLGDTVRHTQTGHAIGTAAYLSPEQVAGRDVTPRADIYALGLVLLESITGEREFVGTPAEAAMMRLHRDPTIPAGLPDAWTDLLRQMTLADPTLRPDAADVARRLDALGSTAPTPVPAPEADPETKVLTEQHTEVGVAPVAPSVPTGPPPTGPPPSAPPPSTPPSGPPPSRPPASSGPPPSAGQAARELRESAARAWQRSVAWLRSLSPQARGVAASIGALVLLLVIVAIAGNASSEDPLPDGTPDQLREPLRDLHEAVHGEG